MQYWFTISLWRGKPTALGWLGIDLFNEQGDPISFPPLLFPRIWESSCKGRIENREAAIDRDNRQPFIWYNYWEIKVIYDTPQRIDCPDPNDRTQPHPDDWKCIMRGVEAGPRLYTSLVGGMLNGGRKKTNKKLNTSSSFSSTHLHKRHEIDFLSVIFPNRKKKINISFPSLCNRHFHKRQKKFFYKPLYLLARLSHRGEGRLMSTVTVSYWTNGSTVVTVNGQPAPFPTPWQRDWQLGKYRLIVKQCTFDYHSW